MPLRNDIKKVMVIGSGPIVIGQAAEFDYAGTQACRSLKEEGLEVVLVNSNPATIMTDVNMADRIYIEPLSIDFLKRIIALEQPDSLLPNLGGQTGLNLAMELHECGYLDEMGVKLIGAKPESIFKAEDREAFRQTMMSIGEPIIPSTVAESIDEAARIAKELGYPVVVRPGYTLGGSGGGIVRDEAELREIASGGLLQSRVHQILIEKSVEGWKEIEYEVMRDSAGNVITICNMENLDPVGIHTGDSVVIAPTQTLTAKEHAMLRRSALKIVDTLGVEGGCNVQFALNPNSFEYALIEVNPRVSRSSALASKATGYPIAKVSAKIAIGYTLGEIKNAVTGTTYAASEPSIDYVVVKWPKWPFDKFIYAERRLGTQMKATGEVMAIGQSFEAALMKSIRSAEIGCDRLYMGSLAGLDRDGIIEKIKEQDDERFFAIGHALRLGVKPEEIHDITKIDMWFLNKIMGVVSYEFELEKGNLTEELYEKGKIWSYPDSVIERLSGQKVTKRRRASYKTVDTCAAEFDAETPYYYSSWDLVGEGRQSDKKKVIVLGSGPIRIGQGIEFDYCSVHCVWASKAAGYETVIINNNPETVSTDFDTADRLYFEPLCEEDVLDIIEAEKPEGVIVQFGGQTAIKLAEALDRAGVPILGTPAGSIDAAEDREKFDAILARCGIPRPEGETVFTTDEAVDAANRLGYPVLVRPSYVLGGQGMAIAYDDNDVREFMAVIGRVKQEHPVLVDKYLLGREVEVDAICDGDNILIPGIMEHIERAGVHSGDSISVYPPQNISRKHRVTMATYTEKLARALKVKGLINIQFVIYNDEVYVIEANPRSSRTVPYISKVTGVPMVALATRCVFGEKLIDMGYGTGVYPDGEYVAVKVPVFSFEKLHRVDTLLGPEMKSTGEVLGVARTFSEALYKGLVGANMRLVHEGGVLLTLKDADKLEMVDTAAKFLDMGFDLYGTTNTALTFNNNMVATSSVRKISEPEPNINSMIREGRFSYIVSTAGKSRRTESDNIKLRRMAVDYRIPCLTSIDTAKALADCLGAGVNADTVELTDITKI